MNSKICLKNRKDFACRNFKNASFCSLTFLFCPIWKYQSSDACELQATDSSYKIQATPYANFSSQAATSYRFFGLTFPTLRKFGPKEFFLRRDKFKKKKNMKIKYVQLLCVSFEKYVQPLCVF